MKRSKRSCANSSTSSTSDSGIPFAHGFQLRTESEQVAAVGQNLDEEERRWLSSPFTDFGPIPRPTSVDDWLAQYRETGQDYTKFVRQNPWVMGRRRRVTYAGRDFDPSGKTMGARYPEGKMYLAEIGDFRSDAGLAPDFDELVRFAETYLRVPVKKFASFDVFEEAGEVYLDGSVLGRRIRIKSRHYWQRSQSPVLEP